MTNIVRRTRKEFFVMSYRNSLQILSCSMINMRQIDNLIGQYDR